MNERSPEILQLCHKIYDAHFSKKDQILHFLDYLLQVC